MEIQKSHFILYVRDQAASTAFYAQVLMQPPALDVPGMTEFELSPGTILGLMPEAGIRRLLGERLPPLAAEGSAKAELYLVVADAQAMLERALAAGGRLLSELARRDWGHRVGYCLDLDGYVLGIAEIPFSKPKSFTEAMLGLHSEIWEGIDVKDYIDGERGPQDRFDTE